MTMCWYDDDDDDAFTYLMYALPLTVHQSGFLHLNTAINTLSLIYHQCAC